MQRDSGGARIGASPGPKIVFGVRKNLTRNDFCLHQLLSNKDSDQASSEWMNHLVRECAGLQSIGVSNFC
uniref:Uncharacterized protein n=1 Tax=Aegilops tauschii subsp. strangulata TaxID=200361 RepID=A0A453HYK4_AEGTS